VPDIPEAAIEAAARVLGSHWGGPPDDSDTQLAADVLAAAAPLLAETCAPEPSGSEWGYRDDKGEIVNMGEDGQPTALSVIHAAERVGWHRTLIRRAVTYGPWEEVPGA
jgi:hypothetical protein